MNANLDFEYRECSECHKVKKDVELHYDPLSLELCNEKEECYLCKKCYQERIEEI